MKRLKPEKKRLILSITAAILIVVMLIGAALPFIIPVAGAEPSGSDDIAVEAEIGFNGNIKVVENKYCCLTEFKIKVKNNSDKVFEGNVSIALNLNSESYKRLKAYVEINPKSEESVYFEEPVGSISKSISVEVNDKNNETIKTEEFPVVCHSQSDKWTAMLTNANETENSKVLSLIKYYTGYDEYINKTLFKFDENNFPKSRYVLYNFNLIIIDDFEFDSLNEDQKTAIEDWIYNGGILIASSSFSSEFEKLKSLSNTLGNTIKYENFIETEYEAAYETEKEIQNNITVLSYGSGKIYYNNFYFNDSFTNSLSFSNEIVSLSNDLIQSDNFANDFSETAMYFNDRRPIYFNDITIKIIFIIILLYFIFIGFILYFILKKKDKLKLSIFIIPLSSLVVILIIQLFSIETVYKRPIINMITYFEQDSHFYTTGNFMPVACVSVSSPIKGDIKIDFANDLSVLFFRNDILNDITYEDASFDSESLKNKDIKAEKILGEKNSVTSFDMPKWEQINFAAVKKAEGNVGGINIDVKITADNVFSGNISNNTGYDLYDVIIASRISGSYFVVDKLENGETIALAGLDDFISLDDSENILSRTADKNDEQRIYETRLRDDIFNAVYENKTDAAFMVLGFNNEEIIGGFEVNGKYPNIFTTNIFYAENRINNSSFENNCIPYGFVSPHAEGSGAYIKDDELYTVGYEEIPEYEFYDPDNADLTFAAPKGVNIKSFALDLDTNECSYLIYNFRDGIWQNYYDGILASKSLDYISDSNEVKLVVKTNRKSVNIPKISFNVSGE